MLTLNELVDELYDKEYFGFKESAVDYTMKIVDFIEARIDNPNIKLSKNKYKKYGRKYLKYKANQRTTWYIFFDDKDGKFLVNYIINNHSHTFSELL
ncbi:hypothetical protein HNQ03_001872 [Chryseobacterium sp. 16F]|uniref:Uncharacterized protein n=1 Tax=Frigoriflavimonas asaccharolytica TaxID=2735899 RepID=A0A8J8K980_9FLAO|nr:hypothetical protein [Frigoriflavimonas asaccharolytica]